MKIITNLSVILGLCILFCGCPYETTVPIDSATTKINTVILGNWKVLNETETYKITRQDDFTYAIEAVNKDKKVEHYLASPSDVNGTIFLNLWENKPDQTEKKYLIYKLELSDDNTLKISPVSENVREKFTSSAELKKFISENMKNSYLFEKEGTLTRIK